MARVFKLTNGTIDVDLIDTAATGIIAQRGGFGSSRLRADLDFVSTSLQDGGILRSAQRQNVVERYSLRLKGSDHNNAAFVMQQLHELLIKAEQYHTTSWQTTPVYLQVQTTNETNARFALVYGSPEIRTPDFFDQPFESSDEIENIDLRIIREPYWRSAAPRTLPTEITLQGVQEPGVNGVEQFVQLELNEQALNNIFVDNGGVFGSNLVASTDYDLLPATPAVGDAVYFGDTNPFFTLIFDLSTLASGVTGQWEFFNGAWVNADVGGADGTNEFEGSASQTGQYAFYVGDVGGWALTTVNSVANTFWLRFRVTAIASPSPPHQSATQTVGMGQRNMVEIPNSSIDGDTDALARFWFSRKVDPAVNSSIGSYGQIIGGVRTRDSSGNTDTSYLQCLASGTMAGVSGVAGTDTAALTNQNFHSSGIHRCTFATVATIATRFTIQIDDTRSESWQGSWQVYFLGYQTLGSAKDVEVQLLWSVNGIQSIFNDIIPMQRVEPNADGEVVEVINLGRVDLPPIEKTRGLVPDGSPALTQIKLVIRALSNNGSTPNLQLCGLVLIPIDEYSFRITRPDVAQGTDVYALGEDRAVVMDGGLVGEGAELLTQGNTGASALTTNAMQWMLRSDTPKLPPDKTVRIYFLPVDSADPSATNGFIVSSHAGFFVRIWTHERWHTLRGAD